jgi:O-antigen/teichoic acid export membrane protein
LGTKWGGNAEIPQSLWSFFRRVAAVNIIAGRLLGPEEYGKYSLVFLISQIFLIPMIFGMDMAISRVISKEAFQNVENIRKNISSAFWFVFFISMLSLVLLLTIFLVYLPRPQILFCLEFY